jgi:hypothetical protein
VSETAGLSKKSLFLHGQNNGYLYAVLPNEYGSDEKDGQSGGQYDLVKFALDKSKL